MESQSNFVYVCEWFILFGMMSLRVTHVVACVRISVPFKLNNIPFTSLVAQIVKNLPAMQETQLLSLGWEDPLEEGMATHSSILAWRIPWTEEPGVTVPGVTNNLTRLRDWHTQCSLFHCRHTLHFPFPFIHQWALTLLPPFGCYK